MQYPPLLVVDNSCGAVLHSMITMYYYKSYLLRDRARVCVVVFTAYRVIINFVTSRGQRPNLEYCNCLQLVQNVGMH